MKRSTFNRLIGLLLLLLLIAPAAPAFGQAAPDTGGFDPQKLEDQAKDLLQQLQQPGVDPQQTMQQFRDLMQQFRDQTANMDPNQVDQIRQRMMEHLQPLFIQAMPTIMRRMQERRMEQYKSELECTDEEFAALKPALQKVMDAQQTVAMAGMRRGPGGMAGGGPPPAIPGAASPLAAAMRELHDTLQDPGAKSDMIKAKLDAVRQARDQANHDLAVARAELRPLLTVRQESILVADGMLD